MFLAGLAVSAASPAVAEADWSTSFVETFQSACVPERTSYERTLSHVRGEGWSAFDVSEHAEFSAMMEIVEEAVEADGEDMDMTFESETLARHVEGRPLHLVVSLVESEYLDTVGCYLYDFDADAPIQTSVVSNLLGVKPAQMHRDETIESAVWGPPPSMPGTLDTYLTYIPPGSAVAKLTGFDGVVLKFTTSVGAEN